jgi:hypothetical protein
MVQTKIRNIQKIVDIMANAKVSVALSSTTIPHTFVAQLTNAKGNASSVRTVGRE